MTAHENEALAREFVEEVWNGHNLDAIDELFSPDYVGHWFDLTGEDVGRDGLKTFVQNVLTGFPDYEMNIEYVHADDEIVTLGFRGGGTHEGEFYGIPPTEQAVTEDEMTPGIMSMRVTDGQVVEGWATWDALGMLQGIGVLPEDPSQVASADD